MDIINMDQTMATDDPYTNSDLFSSYYLDERLQRLDVWECGDSARETLNQLQELFDQESHLFRHTTKTIWSKSGSREYSKSWDTRR
jgi:hypothetical protein